MRSGSTGPRKCASVDLMASCSRPLHGNSGPGDLRVHGKDDGSAVYGRDNANDVREEDGAAVASRITCTEAA